MQAVILSYNHPQLTEKAVQSTLEHFPANNCILVHNGSLPNHLIQLKNRFPEIHHLVISENKGFSGGANAGLELAFQKSEWALLITNDCELLRVNEVDLEPGIYAPLIYKRQTNEIDSLGAAYNEKSLSLRRPQRLAQ